MVVQSHSLLQLLIIQLSGIAGGEDMESMKAGGVGILLSLVYPRRHHAIWSGILEYVFQVVGIQSYAAHPAAILLMPGLALTQTDERLHEQLLARLMDEVDDGFPRLVAIEMAWAYALVFLAFQGIADAAHGHLAISLVPREHVEL